MYVGGTDASGLHNMALEIFGNAVDEAVEGHASEISVELRSGDILVVRDNGRGIPVDRDPRSGGRSALEVILSELHAGGKFGDKVYNSSRLLGVGMAVVNALSEWFEVEVSRNARRYRIRCERGDIIGGLEDIGHALEPGTMVSFHPDPLIFETDTRFSPAQLYRMVRSHVANAPSAEFRWACDASLISDDTPTVEVMKSAGGSTGHP